MEAVLVHGKVEKPVVVAVGVWDPFLSLHRDMISSMNEYAKTNDLNSLVLMLYPDPSTYMLGAQKWPTYNDFTARLGILQSCRPDAILHTYFAKADLQATAADLFDLLQAHFDLSEMWLGNNQFLGSGLGGSPETVARLAEARQVKITRLPETELRTTARDIRQNLATGHIVEATRLVGRPPIRTQPQNEPVRVAWTEGHYRALALEHPLATTGTELELKLEADADGFRTFNWPASNINYLAFIAGPADLAA